MMRALPSAKPEPNENELATLLFTSPDKNPEPTVRVTTMSRMPPSAPAELNAAAFVRLGGLEPPGPAKRIWLGVSGGLTTAKLSITKAARTEALGNASRASAAIPRTATPNRRLRMGYPLAVELTRSH